MLAFKKYPAKKVSVYTTTINNISPAYPVKKVSVYTTTINNISPTCFADKKESVYTAAINNVSPTCCLHSYFLCLISLGTYVGRDR